MAAFQGIIQPIWLKPSVQQELGKHLLTCYPHEACGILLGAAAAGGMYIDTYVPMHNVAPDPLHAFVPDPREWVKALYRNPAPVGLFHSHPSAEPRPSAADLSGLASLGPSFDVYLIGSPNSSEDSPLRLNGYYIVREQAAAGRERSSLREAPIYALLK
ncbi:M67 family metallopeptidase [Paenibacillus donghaensis]|nr:M67 family metallopeptidase [Paenibacillus donghaensis]